MRPLKIPFIILILFFSVENIGAQCIARSAGPDPQTVCINTPITNVVYKVVSGVTGVSPDGLPTGITGTFSLADLTYTLSGTPTVSGSFIYTLTTQGGCIGITGGTINVNPNSTIDRTSPPPTTSQTVCINNSITNITYSVGGSANGAFVTGLPSGVNSMYSGGTLTISGAPTVSGTFPYTVTTTGPCVQTSLSGSIRVNPDASITLTSGNNNQTICINNPVTPITYLIAGGGTGANVLGLPNGVSGNYSGGIFTISGTPIVSGIFNYTVTTTGTCAQTTATGTISINQNSTISLSSPGGSNSQTVCINTAIANIVYQTGGGATGAGVTGLPAGVNGVYNAGVFTISGTPSVAGTFTYTVTTTGPCIQASATGSIRVNPNAAITLTSAPGTDNQNLCVNNPISPIIYSVTGGGTGASVNGLPAGVTGVYSGGVFTISGIPTVTGIFNYTVTTSGTCLQTTATGTINVVLNAVITLTSAPGTNVQNVCINSPITNITYSVSGGGNGATVMGLPAGVTGTYLAGIFTISGTPTAAGIFNYTVTTTGTCTQVSATGIITVISLPVATASNNGPLCVGSPLNLTGGPAGMATYSWTGPNNFISNLQSPVVSPSANLLMQGVYILTVTNLSGCRDTASTRVYIYAVPVANAGLGGTTCGLGFTLNAVPSVGIGQWSMVDGPGTPTFLPNTHTPGATVSVTAYGTYNFRWTETNGPCISSAVVTVIFSQQPSANAGTGGSVCGTSFSLNAVPSVGTGQWRVLTGPGTATFVPDANTPGAVANVSTYGAYTFEWTETNGTCVSSASVVVTFYQQPVANPGTGGNNCGLDFNLRAVASAGTGTWTRVNGPGTAIFSPNANSPTAKVTVSAYGTYTFRWTEVNGPCNSSATINIVFIQMEPADGGNNGIKCSKTFTFNAHLTIGTGTWSQVSGPGTSTFSPNANQPNATVTVTQFGTYEYLWTVVNSTCTSTDLINVKFFDVPSVSAGPDLAVCKGSNIQLSASGTGSFLWAPANLLNNPSSQNPVATLQQTTLFTVTLTDQNGCKNTDQVNVEVRVQPVADAGPDQVLDYMFQTVMQALAVESPDTGTWSILAGHGEFSANNEPSAEVTNLSLGVNSFLWTVSNGACPDAVDTVNIKVNDLVIPTLITPNLDGKNDFFIVRGIESLGSTSLTIFDRWGARLYENDKYDNTWDGTDFNGKPLPPDTYFFILSPQKSRAITGYIVIRR